jgi:hypothetical protein
MNKITSSILALALSSCIFSVSAATSTTDDSSKLGTSDTPQVQQQDKTTNETMPAKKSMSKKDRMHKKMKSKMHQGENTNSMNDKPIGTTNGVSNNGSTDDTKVGEPINGTTTGTNNNSDSK